MSGEDENIEIARRWCRYKGSGWEVLDTAGRGGTAPVFTIKTPDGERALKLLDKEFSEGTKGEETRKRVDTQLQKIGQHDCPYVVQIYDGGFFEDRYYLMMNKAAGKELAKFLPQIPRNKISTILDQVTKACLFLRDRDLCHRDIKSANVFVTDDFEQCTLLDLSVMREIYDPVGIGTDHGGFLPVVATSRYSPPEYLFRLVDPGPELWHALDIYQLGGLLHDMIMRAEMFETEYQYAKENRYRFAWLVATQTPEITGDDVDPSLLFLARRALDKDWKRRSTLNLEDFLPTASSHGKLGLELIGLAPKLAPIKADAAQPLRSVVAELATSIEEQIIEYQRSLGITAGHRSEIGHSDNERRIRFEWNLNTADVQSPFDSFVLTYSLRAIEENGLQLDVTASLMAFDKNNTAAQKHQVEIALPRILFSEHARGLLFSNCVSAITELAAKLVEGPRGGKI